MAMMLTHTMAAMVMQAAVAGGPPMYSATILPQIDDTDSEFKLTYTSPFALNNSKQVVGSLGNNLGFTWNPNDGGQWLQPMFSSFADSATGTSINAAGEIGGSYAPTGQFRLHPFLLKTDGTFVALPTLGENLSAGVTDINDNGMLVGNGEREQGGTFGGPQSSLYWRNNQVFEIGTLGAEVSAATAVNNNDVVVGYSNVEAFGPVHPYKWTEGGGFEVLPQLISGVPASPNDINDNGLIVGRGGVSLLQNKAVYWDNTGIHELPSITVDPIDIGVLAVNNSNIMAGFELDSVNFEFAARLWINGNIYNLQDQVIDLPAGYELAQAVDINDHGDIIVEARTMVEGQIQFVSVLLTPTTVPAPGAMALLGLGGVFIRRRRRN